MSTAPFSSRVAYLDRSSELGKFTIELLEDLVYEGLGKKIVVPKGFMSDLATIPRVFQLFIPKVGPYNAAAIVHDWGYCVQFLTRKEVDCLFLDIMKNSKVGFFTRYSMYYFMRLLGSIAWYLSKKDVAKYRRIVK